MGINRRPFRFTEDGMVVNGRICFDVTISEGLSDEQRQKSEDATNDRFEQYLGQCESLLGVVDETRYQTFVDTFVQVVVKSCCTVE